MLARLSVPKAPCSACPQGAPFPAPTAPAAPPGPSAQWRVRQGISQRVQPAGSMGMLSYGK